MRERSAKVLLIGWDAADWKVINPLMAAGKMPNVHRLVRNGSSGQIATLHPPLSPMLWTSIATGKRPFKHGVHGFTEPAPDGSGVRPVTNLSRTSKALWNILSQNDITSTVVGWWPSHPAEPIRGVMVSDRYHRAGGPLDAGWPIAPHTVHPAELAGTLAERRVHPDSLTPQLVEPFIPLAGEIDQDKDKRLAAFLRTLAEAMTIQAAAVWLLDNRPAGFVAVYFEALDHFCHAFMRYHPPRQSWIGERDFELYGGVVSMAYQFHDQMLGTLLERAGGDTTVILMSDHGFHPDHLRPAAIPDIPAGPAIEHRDFGVFAISGPGIKRNEVLHGASVLDVAPTVLTLFGLPVGQDMDGKVLSQAFEKTPAIEFISSWEEVPGADGRHPPHTRLDAVAAREALEQMIALGYIERPDEDHLTAVDKSIRELRYNLGESYQDAGRHWDAREIFAQLRDVDPGEQRFAVRLFVSCQALGLLDEMRRIVADLADNRRAQPAVTDYLRAHVLISEERYREALAALRRVSEAHLVWPGLFVEIGDLYMRVRRWGDAQRIYNEALAADPDNTHAHLGLCHVALRRREFSAAAHAALDALERTYSDPMAHYLLGRALAEMKGYERAAQAFRAAISFNPNFSDAHLRLARLLAQHLGDPKSAREHRRFARAMKGRAAAQPELERAATVPASAGPSMAADASGMPPLSESLIVVTGLPRSGTSLVMQMLAAGGLATLSDETRPADEDNPRGYFEFQPVKNLGNDNTWLAEARGKAIKIVAPLLAALRSPLACRVILCERDLDEVLDSQQRMLQHRNRLPPATPERRRMLRGEYQRTLSRVKVMLAWRPQTRLLVIEYGAAIRDPLSTAGRINDFLGGALDARKMAAVVDPALYRNHSAAGR